MVDLSVLARGPSLLRMRFKPGIVGPAGSVTVGTTTTGAAGSNASVVNTGTNQAAILEFTIPRGNTGTAATIAVGSVSASAPGSSPSIVNAGTSSAAVFDFVLPRGDVGPTGPAVADGDKGDITVSGTGTVYTIDVNVVSDAKLRTSAGLSVIGRTSNTTGNVADITAGTDGHVLRLAGTVLGFGTIVAAGIASDAVTTVKILDANVTNAKLANMANATVKGRNTAGTGVPEDLTGAQVRDTVLPAGFVIDRVYAEYTTNADLTVAIPLDDTIPTSTEGTQVLSVSITPKSVTNRLRVRFQGYGGSNAAAATMIAASFHGASGSAYRTVASTTGGAGFFGEILLEYEFVPGSTSALTIAIRVGSPSTIRLNGTTVGRFFGGSSAASLIVEEIKA